MPDPAPPDQVPPAPAIQPAAGARNRVVAGAAALGLIAVAVVLLTLPTGELPVGVPATIAVQPPAAPAAASPVVTAPPPPAPPSVTPPPAPAVAPPPVAPPASAEIAVTGLPRSAEVRLDGRPAARHRLTVSPGRHILEVTQPGFVSRMDTVQLTAGQQFTWSPRLVASPSAKRVAATTPDRPPARASADEMACQQYSASASWHDAFGSCLRAAQAGSVAAQRGVAVMYQRGNGVARSDENAAHWFEQAARGGDGESMFQLAIACEHGRGVKRDDAAALDWYTRAGSAGIAAAAFAAGDAYEKGHLGAAKDRAKAVEWYRKSAALGNKDAAAKVRYLQR